MALALAALVLPVVTACDNGSSSPQSQQLPSSLNIAIATPLTTMDPTQVSNNQLAGVVDHVYQGLTSVNGKGEIKSLLATDWSVAPDHLTWTFHLRKGVQFSDGTPFNADAVKANYERLFNPNFAVPLLSSAGPVKSLQVVDAYTVQIVTSVPYSGLLASLGGEWWDMVSPKSIQEGGNLSTHPGAGTGPYTIQSFTPPNTLTLVKNSTYWGTPSAIPTLNFQSQSDANTRRASLLSGSADVDVYVTSDQVNEVKANRNLTILKVPSARLFMVVFPMQMPEFQDIRVRQALNYAIDRDQIVKTVYGGLAQTATTSVGSGIGYKPIQKFPYDPKKAASLLSEAGWTKGSDGVLQRGGKAFPTMRFEASNGQYPNDAALSQALAGYLKAAGVPVQLAIEPFATFFPSSAKNAASQGWLVQMAWAAPGNDDAAFLKVVYTGVGGNNWGAYNNPQVAQLTAQIQTEFDNNARMQLIQQDAKAVYDDVPAIFVLNPDFIVGVKNNLTGAYIDPAEFHSFASTRWQS